MQALHHAVPIQLQIPKFGDLTLLELVQAICDVTDDDSEVVATVRHMLRSGRVRLCGNFRRAAVETFD